MVYGHDAQLLSIIYPPPTAKTVTMGCYVQKTERAMLLLSSGTICQYTTNRETAILERVIYQNQIKVR